jgi:AraC-like DNA-binding protein
MNHFVDHGNARVNHRRPLLSEVAEYRNDMAERSVTDDLYDPRTGGRALRTHTLRLDGGPSEPARTNYFAVYFIASGSGTVWADAARFAFGPDALLFFVPYQHVRFVPDGPVHGEVVQFHANFLCVETFHAEVGCSGVLFNDPHGVPVVPLDDRAKPEVTGLIERIRREQGGSELAHGEVMLAYLKVLLILAARLKTPRAETCGPRATDPRHPILVQFRDLIERNYPSWHSPAEYAEALHLTPKALGRIVREHLGATPTDLIRNRILTHAKWHLLHTLKPVKEVARELGFGDELYFSRLFKKATGRSPTDFRDFETEIRGGSNLSMFSARAPILRSAAPGDT